MDMEEVVDRKQGAEAVNASRGKHVRHLTLRASDVLFISRFFDKVLEASFAVDVETRKDFWFVIP